MKLLDPPTPLRPLEKALEHGVIAEPVSAEGPRLAPAFNAVPQACAEDYFTCQPGIPEMFQRRRLFFSHR